MATKKPASKKPATKKEKKTVTATAEKPAKAPKKPKGEKTRRSPYELLQGLKAKLTDLNITHEKKVEKLQDKIALLETKHANKIALGDLLASKTPDEIDADLKVIEDQRKLLRAAKRSSASA